MRFGFVLLVWALPNRAHAHAFETAQGFYPLFLEGASLPFHTPDLVLSLGALGLLIGAWRVDGMPLVWPALAGGGLAGLMLAALAAFDATLPLYAAALVLGLLAVLARPYGPSLMRGATAAAGMAIAYGAAAEHGVDVLPFAAQAGVFASLNFSVAALAGLASLPSRKVEAAWPAIGLRVAASWLVAVTMMMLAFAVRT